MNVMAATTLTTAPTRGQPNELTKRSTSPVVTIEAKAAEMRRVREVVMMGGFLVGAPAVRCR